MDFIHQCRQSMPLIAALGLGSGIAGVANAQDSNTVRLTLEEVVVTAERRKESVQNTAASVTVRSGDELLTEGKFLLRDILEDMPGVLGGAAEAALNTAGGGSDTSGSGISIRGVQSNEGGGGSIVSTAAATAVYVDGVYEGVGGGYDIDRVEVLRGPQGTLYGRSATAGVVAIHTRDPDLAEFGGNVAAEGGSYNLQHYTGALNVPIVTDKLALRVAGNFYERDGFKTDNGLGARTNKDAKVKLLYQPTDSLSILFGVAAQDNEDHTGGRLAGYSSADPGTVTYSDNPLGEGENKFRQYWAELNWDFGAATLTYQPAFRTWEQDSLIVASAGPNFLVNQTQLTPDDDFITHELRLSSNDDSAIKWQVGSLYYKNELSNFNSVSFPQTGQLAFSADTDKTTTAAGIFGEATYPFTDATRVTAGLRYDSTKVETAQDYVSITGSRVQISGQDGTREFDNWTFKLRGEHDLTPDSLVYASVSTGFSPGEVIATTCASQGGNACAIVLDAETLVSYEVGSKNRFLADSLQVNGAVFFYDYGGFQTAGVDISNGANQFTVLESAAEMFGAELEALYQITPSDRVGLNLAYIDARYVDQPETPIRFKTFVAKDEIAYTPPFTANASYTRFFELPGGSSLAIRGDARYISGHDESRLTQVQRDLGGDAFVRVDGEVIGNLSATWTSPNESYTLTGYVRNVADNQYRTRVTILVNETPPGSGNFSTDGGSLTENDPRTYGVVFGMKF